LNRRVDAAVAEPGLAADLAPGPAPEPASGPAPEPASGLAAIAGQIAGGEPAGASVVLADRRGRLVLRFGDVVLKVHAGDVDAAELAARLAIAADPRMGDIMLAPLPIPGAVLGRWGARVGNRFVSAWPAGIPLRPDDLDDVARDGGDDRDGGVVGDGGVTRDGGDRGGGDDRRDGVAGDEGVVGRAGVVGEDGVALGGDASGEDGVSRGGGDVWDDDDGDGGASWADVMPWEEAAVLLARLHAVPVPAVWALPPAGVCRRLERAVGRLADLDDSSAHEVLRAYAALPDWVREVPARPGGLSVMIHGDWHLGQLVRLGGRGAWRVIDVDDVGFGDPAWDLARPAACYAAGLLAPRAWQRLLSGYQAAGGCAVPRHGDAWAALDATARALAVHCAATAVADAAAAREPLDYVGHAFVDCCRRMTRLRSPYADPLGTLRAALPGVPTR
jgi:hypothetical protein